MDDRTSLYDLSTIKESLVLVTLKQVYDALAEIVYSPSN